MSNSKRPPRTYLVRGFDPANEQFKHFGSMSQRATFRDATVPSQAAAIVAMLTSPDFKSMSATAVAPSNTHVDELHVIKLNIETSLTSARDLDKDLRSEIGETITRWAEKLRIPGRRGFRISAIKTPLFERDETNNGCVTIKAEVILGTAIFYSNYKNTINLPGTVDEFKYDLGNLAEHVGMATPYFTAINAEHSKFGEVIFTKGDALPTLPSPVVPGTQVVDSTATAPSISYPQQVAAAFAGDSDED